jgi:hypothetical protein
MVEHLEGAKHAIFSVHVAVWIPSSLCSKRGDRLVSVCYASLPSSLVLLSILLWRLLVRWSGHVRLHLEPCSVSTGPSGLFCFLFSLLLAVSLLFPFSYFLLLFSLRWLVVWDSVSAILLNAKARHLPTFIKIRGSNSIMSKTNTGIIPTSKIRLSRGYVKPG